MQIAFPAHGRGGYGGPAEAKNLNLHILRNRMIVFILDFMAIDAEGRKAFLSMGGQNGSQINRAGALGSVEPPNGFDGHGVHIHGFSPIAPTGSDGQSDVDALLFEIIGAGGRFGNAPNRRGSNDDFHRLPIAVAKVFFEQLFGGQSHSHGLLLQRFANLQRPSPAVDGRTDADHRVGTNET